MTRSDTTSRGFAGLVAVVTGASSGIGKQLAFDLASLGAHVVLSSQDSERLVAAADECRRAGLDVESVVCDVRSASDVHALSDAVLTRYGHVDLLINNAGYAVYRSFEESPCEELLDIIDVNLLGAIRCTKAFLPSMLLRRSGRIVNVSSIGGRAIITPNAAYCAAKHAMVAWTRATRYELAEFNIRTNVVCPAHTITSFHDHPTFRRRDPYRRPGRGSLDPIRVSKATLDAIRSDRVVTTIPRWQGAVVWALNALPALTEPLWASVNRRRVSALYAQIEIEKTRPEH